MSPVYIKTRIGKTGKRYLVYWRRGGRSFREQYAGSFKTKKEAGIRRDLVAGELAAGRDPQLVLDALKQPATQGPQLETIWDAFISSRLDVGDKARRQYRNARDRWLPLLGRNRDPATLTPADIVAAIAELFDGDDGLSPGTLSQYVSNLAMVLDFADLEPNPARSAKVKIPAGSQAEKTIPANQTWEAIRGQIKKRSQLAVRLMEACALRVTEATSLEWGDVDFVEGAIRIRRAATKTAAGRRWVPVPAELLDDIADLLPLEDRSAERIVFAVNSGTVYRDIVAACTAAGVPEYGTHAFRHRRISLWLRHGIDAVQVSRWSGHSKPSESTDIYGHVIVDPRGDEWRPFWLAVYAARHASGAVPVRHEEGVE
jgi:integrase